MAGHGSPGEQAIRLEPVAAANRAAVVALAVHDHQRAFLTTPSLAKFLDEAPAHPTFTPYAIVAGTTVVGMVSVGHEPRISDRWWIPLLIIDRRYQGKGYGRAAMEQVIAHVRREAPECTALGLGYTPGNAVAAGLYQSLGFVTDGYLDGQGEVQAWLPLPR